MSTPHTPKGATKDTHPETPLEKLQWCIAPDYNVPTTNKLARLSGHLIDNAREPYEKWAAGFCTDVEGAINAGIEAIAALQAENGQLTDALAQANELIRDVGGRTTEFAVINQIDALRDSMRKGNAPEAMQNLIDACSHLAAFSVAHARWAALATIGEAAAYDRAEAAERTVGELRRLLNEVKAKAHTWRRTASVHSDLHAFCGYIIALKPEPSPPPTVEEEG